LIKIYQELEEIFQSQNNALLQDKCKQYLKEFPEDITINIYYSRCLLLKKNFTECEEVLKKILNYNQNHVEANLNLGRVYANLLQYDFAIRQYSEVLKQDKSYFVLFELAEIYFKSGDIQKSFLTFNELLKIKTDIPEVFFYLGLIYHKTNNFDEAIASFKKAINYKKNYAAAYNNLGLLFVEKLNLDEAIFFYNQAIKYNPNIHIFYTNLAQVYLAKGDFHNVKHFINKALDIDPSDGEAHRILSVITNYENDHDHLNKMKNIFKTININDISKMHLSFALAKAYEEKKDFKSSSFFLILANKIRRSNFDFNITTEINQFELFQKFFSKSFFTKHKSSGFKSKKPIFILGMPRSGTSLVEQIISSHRDVFGGGELSFLANTINKYLDYIDPKAFFEGVDKADGSTFNEIGEHYINSVNQLSNNKKYVTDKMPINFRLIGFIKIALPNAKVIHCQRLAKDTCLSIFKNYFGKDVMPWAYDQKELALYYKNYENLMDYWNKTLPNFIYNISYENLLNNQEIETKKLLNFCGLDWDESCLNFYRNKRAVSTASTNQVRKNIYKSSMNSWKNYENALADLFNHLT